MYKLIPLLIAGLFSVTAHSTPITSLADPALSGASLWDFNELPTGATYSTTPIVSPSGEVTFTPVNTAYRIFDFTSSGFSNGVGIRAGAGTTPASVFNFIFGSTVSAFSLNLAAINSQWTLTAFDTNGVLIESTIWPNVCCSPTSRGIAAPEIKSFQIRGNDVVVIDNLYYSTNKIPAPSTLALLGLGLAGLGLTRRKKA